jgi:hypothetical protein
MLFQKESWEGIANGSITVAFRRWQRPTVVAGRPYRTAAGRIEVLTVDVVDPRSISDEDARKAGVARAADIHAALRDTPTGAAEPWQVYRVTFRVLQDPDPRAALAESNTLSDADVAALDARLDKLDRLSGHGAWTRATLAMIAARPGVRAPDLAASVGRETLPFKVDVRKLKNLGLTLSLKVGYRISPRSQAYLAAKPMQR